MTKIYTDQLIAYIFHELPVEEELTLKAALNTDADLRQIYTELKESLQLILTAPVMETPDEIVNRILEESSSKDLIC